MDNFDVNINLTSSTFNGCIRDVLRKNVTINTVSQVIELQNNYTLHVLNKKENYITLLIQNGIYVFVRLVYVNCTLELCLPSCNYITLCLNWN